ncbi:nucleotidyltransferase family protein [Acidisoma sp. 7E03]
MAEIAALLLAAGLSRRMGTTPKLLQAGADGRPMVLHALDHLLAVFPQVTVVLGHDAAAMGAVLAARPVRLVVAEDYAEGLAASLRTGLVSLPANTEAVLVALADMPGVSPETLRALVSAHRPGQVTVPVFAGTIGNPILWDRDYFVAMRALTGDRGARSLLPADCLRVAVPDEGILRDVDTQEDLKSWQARL